MGVLDALGHNPPACHYGTGRFAPAGFGGFPASRPAVPLADIVKDPRMFSLDDPGYWSAIAPLRIASGLPNP